MTVLFWWIKSTMKLSRVSIFWEYAKKRSSNLVLVVVLVLESKGLYPQLLHSTKTTDTGSSSGPVDLIAPVCLHLNFRGRPFDFWGGGGVGYGWFQKEKYPADWFRGEKILARKYLAEKNPTPKKISFMAYNAEKNSYTVVCQEKILSLEVWEK